MAYWNEWRSPNPTKSLSSHPNADSRRYKGSKQIRLEDRDDWVYWQTDSARYQEKARPSLEADTGSARIIQFPKIMMSQGKKEIKGARASHNPTQGTICKDAQAQRESKKPERASPGTRSKARRTMASSSKGPMSTEERLKEMDKTLANLQQMLQHQLDFLENLDVEAGRRLEQLESDITLTKIGFAEELDKLHQELKNPQQEFDERMEQLEAKMAQLNSTWNQDEEK
jgi:hypothetical protein